MAAAGRQVHLAGRCVADVHAHLYGAAQLQGAPALGRDGGRYGRLVLLCLSGSVRLSA